QGMDGGAVADQFQVVGPARPVDGAPGEEDAPQVGPGAVSAVGGRVGGGLGGGQLGEPEGAEDDLGGHFRGHPDQVAVGPAARAPVVGQLQGRPVEVAEEPVDRPRHGRLAGPDLQAGPRQQAARDVDQGREPRRPAPPGPGQLGGQLLAHHGAKPRAGRARRGPETPGSQPAPSSLTPSAGASRSPGAPPPPDNLGTGGSRPGGWPSPPIGAARQYSRRRSPDGSSPPGRSWAAGRPGTARSPARSAGPRASGARTLPPAGRCPSKP